MNRQLILSVILIVALTDYADTARRTCRRGQSLCRIGRRGCRDAMMTQL